MSSLNSRFKSLGLGKRKSTASIHSVQAAPPTIAGTPPPGQIPQAPTPAQAQAQAHPQTPQPQQHQFPHPHPLRTHPGQTQTQTPPPPGSSSSPMNHQGPGARPPSYTAGNYPQPPQGAMGRTSPMAPGQNRTPPTQMTGGPPPINTGAPVGYPPNMNPMGQMPPGMPQGGPPQGAPGYGQPTGYPPGPPPAGGPIAQQFQQNNPAAEVEGASRSKAQLIVGIDFGTTFSGVAFAFATNNEAKEDIITEWPGAGSYTKQKIPTVLYYDQYQKVVGWGPDIADALAPTGYPKPGVQKVEWFKLQLMLSGNTYIDPINLPPLPPGKSEIDVAADYLFKLRQAMRSSLQKTLGEVFNREERNIRYYLTVPAIWNDAGKAATRAAAIQAGFLRDENDNRLTLVSEPEAAALFCSKTGLLNLKVHDAVLIVDCGGGTVDLIAYEVEDENPFTVAECTAGSGDSCGSTALNRNFSNILRTKIRKMKLPDGSKTAGRVYAKCIMDFENRIKADFRNNGQKWAVDVGIEAEFPEAGIEEGYMTFTNEEILQCFEPVVNRILELVRNQIIAIQAQNRTLQNILVVGGFGASEYLFQQIKLHVPPQFQSKVVRPMDSVAAIVKGAVTAGITERVITHRIARRHYLMATLQPFKEGYHPEAYRVPSLDGKDRCKFTRQIFVHKGQKVKNGEPYKVSFFRQVAPGATLMYEDVLYACDDDVCPEYTKDPRIKEVVTLTSDLSRKNLEKDFERMDTPQGTFYRVYFDIYLTLDGSEFSAELVCQGEVMGRCRARFR
ncbi:Heat shock 70 kDa protein 12A [Trichoderma ghanense]|uniref:Heat shock 70 kDa protein 12A n=1 Tax=Trichoderma ghanense TaxID=65468 RepID=A0ABY2H0S9_9HYPO